MVFVVHSLAHAVAALGAAAAVRRPVTLSSAPDAGIYGGPGWFGALIAAARNAVPAAQCAALIDSGDDAGATQAAIRAGIEGVVFTGRADVAERLADIAGQRGARLLTARPVPALDLGGEFFATPEALRRRCGPWPADPGRARAALHHTSCAAPLRRDPVRSCGKCFAVGQRRLL